MHLNSKKRIAALVAALSAALGLAACDSHTESAPQSAALMTESALQAHVNFLADDLLKGRMTGTDEYEISARYVAAQFQQLGLEPAGDEGSYLQAVPYASAMLPEDGVRVSIIGPQGERELAWKDEFVAGADPVRKQVGLRAPAVFVGYGVHAPELDHDDYAGIDVKGKVVVAFSGAPPSFGANERAYHSTSSVKAKAAVEHGAVGWIGLRAAHQIERYPWEDWSRNAGLRPTMAWIGADGAAADFHPELKASIGLSETAAPLLFEGAKHQYAALAELQAAGEPLPRFALPVQISTARSSRIEKISSSNVVARLPGSNPDKADEHVVYTAHLDHVGIGAPVDGDEIYNGAYDNAMGVSLLIESARALIAAQPERSILFVAVGGEERGLLGSDYFAHYPPVPTAKMVANINLDMPLFLYPLADVIAFGSEHSSLAKTVADAAKAEGLSLAEDPLPEEVLFIRSDQYSLVKQGVPAIFLVPGFSSTDPEIEGGALFSDFLNTHYHKPSDDLSRPVHWESALRFARTNVQIGLQVANAKAPPTWNAGNFFGELFAADR